MEQIKAKIIKNFLIDIKKLISQGKFIVADSREKNMKFLRKHGMTVEDIRVIIFDLDISNYKRGPTDDHNTKFKGMIWQFVYLLELSVDINIYIKIRYNPPNEVVCISFHD